VERLWHWHARKMHGPDATYFQVDICDHESVRRICDQVKPDGIYHLAGVASPAGFHLTPYNSFQINIMGLFGAWCDEDRKQKRVLLLVGSSTNIRPSISITHSRKKSPLDPTSFYGVFKICRGNIGNTMSVTMIWMSGSPAPLTIRAPGQAPDFVCSDWPVKSRT